MKKKKMPTFLKVVLGSAGVIAVVVIVVSVIVNKQRYATEIKWGNDVIPTITAVTGKRNVNGISKIGTIQAGTEDKIIVYEGITATDIDRYVERLEEEGFISTTTMGRLLMQKTQSQGTDKKIYIYWGVLGKKAVFTYTFEKEENRMSESEALKITFVLMHSLGSILLFFLAFKYFYGFLIQEKRCTAKTKGIVRKYSSTPGNGIGLPKVYYSVDNKEYKVIGPRYKGFKQISTTTLMGNNDMEFEETKDQRFIVKRKLNSFISFKKNPMVVLFPKGSEIDVYYDPNNPKVSYVLRYCSLKWLFWLFFIAAVFLLLLAILEFFLL